MAGFKRFLGQCDKMVAFVGPTCAQSLSTPALANLSRSHLLPADFTRLWCVYELATFTKMHGMHKTDAPGGKLVLLSLSWPSRSTPSRRRS